MIPRNSPYFDFMSPPKKLGSASSIPLTFDIDLSEQDNSNNHPEPKGQLNFFKRPSFFNLVYKNLNKCLHLETFSPLGSQKLRRR